MAEMASDSVEAQRRYTATLKKEGADFGLVLGDAFVRGMRDLGYKHTGTALDELVDNAIEAGAQNVHVVFGYDEAGGSEKKPSMLAVVDDGHGMEPDMIRAAVIWGGTHRENSRELFGRYGFGLPSSCASQGTRFEVYSRTEGTGWHVVAIDLVEIGNGTFYRENGRLAAPPPVPQDPPGWALAALQGRGRTASSHATIVVIKDLDRLRWRTTGGLKGRLLEHFGVTYRNFLREVRITVDGEAVEKVDPLFLDPTGRFYDENEMRAEAYDPTVVEVKDKASGKVEGVITVRYSYMPPGFQGAEDAGRGQTNPRFSVMKDNNGILVLRAGRQIDVVSAKCPWTTFQNYDRNIGVEVDFPPALDEAFSITTSKQQVVLSDRMWTYLKEAGVYRVIQEMRERFDVERKALQSQKEKEAAESSGLRTSEQVMQEADKFRTRPPITSPEQLDEREETFQREVSGRADITGKARKQVERELVAEQKDNPFRLDLEALPEGAFYRPTKVRSQVRVAVNKAHPFFTDVYMGPDTTPQLRAALELLLFTLGACEVEADVDGEQFYRTERMEWSRRLMTVFRLLSRHNSIADQEAAVAERAEANEADAETEPSSVS